MLASIDTIGKDYFEYYCPGWWYNASEVFSDDLGKSITLFSRVHAQARVSRFFGKISHLSIIIFTIIFHMTSQE